MKRLAQFTRTALLAAAAVALAACATTGSHPAPAPSSPAEEAFFTTVKPLIESRCVWCHSNRKPSAGLNFEDRGSTLATGSAFIVAGKPEESRIYRAVTLESAHPRVMPGDGWGITAAQGTAIKDWILGGAPWPDDRSARIKRKPYRVDHDDYR